MTNRVPRLGKLSSLRTRIEVSKSLTIVKKGVSAIFPASLVTWSSKVSGSIRPPLEKLLVSSASRTLFSGAISVLTEQEHPLYRIERKSIQEFRGHVNLKQFLSFCNNSGVLDSNGLGSAHSHLGHNRWVVVAHAASLCLRNIDHLFPSARPSPAPTSHVDLLWAEQPQGTSSSTCGIPGLVAFRLEHVELVTDLLCDVPDSDANVRNQGTEWMRAFLQMPLRKRPFEKGEVYSPVIGAVDWKTLSNAAFVTVPDWPEKEQWKFLQALYFGTYFGDETGLMLNILDP